MVIRRSPAVTIVAALCAGLGCGEPDPCEPLAGLCSGDNHWLDVAVRVDDAVALDLDGDGAQEFVALSRNARQIALAHTSGWRSLLFVPDDPVALAAVKTAGGDELAVAMTDPPAVVLFGSDADGRLERRGELPLTGVPDALWSGELDGDAGPQLIVAHAALGKLARIDRTTGETRLLAAGEAPVAVAVADLDDDGVLDIVVADHAPHGLQVLRGAGGGEFHPARAVAGLAPASDLVLADVDGDGDIDALTRGTTAASVEIHHNDGDGALAPAVERAFAAAPSGPGLAVVPGAPGAPAAVSVPQHRVLGTWFGDVTGWIGRSEQYLFKPATWVGRGTADDLLVGGEAFVTRFVHRAGQVPVELWRDPQVRDRDGAVTTGDLDGDGDLDLVTATRDALDIFLGAADGSFTRARTVELGDTPAALEIAEVTGDGRPDILLAGADTVRLLQAGDHGTYKLHPAYTPKLAALSLIPLRTGVTTPAAIAVVPRRADRFHSARDQSPGFAVLRFAGDGAVVDETAAASELVVHALIAVDFDADGIDEPLLVGLRDDRRVLTRLTSQGPGPEHDLAALVGQELYPWLTLRMSAGDVDGDGAPEVLVGVSEGGILLSGLVDDEPTATIDPSLGSVGHLRDIDGDGQLDAVNLHTTSLLIRRGRGDGTFEPYSQGHDFPELGAVALARTTGAAFDLVSVSRDAVAAYRVRDVVRPVREDDPSDFQGPADELVTGDIDGDGDADAVIVSHRSGGGMSVLWGGPDGLQARVDGFNGRLENHGVALGDLDGDGFPEVVTADGVALMNVLRVWPRREKVPMYLGLSTLHRVEDLAVADVDGDGLADILALAYMNFEEIDEMIVAVAYGRGDLEFEKFFLAATIARLEHARLSVGDLDGVHALDLLIRPTGEAAPLLALGVGPRAWSEPRVLPGQAAVLTPADAQGRAELLVHDGAAIVRLPDGASGQPVAIADDRRLAGARLDSVADVDADGRPDLIVAEPSGFRVWLADADGHRPALEVPRSFMETLRVADLDGDGRPDLVGLAAGRVAVRLARLAAEPHAP